MSTVPKAVRASYGALPGGWRLGRLKFFSTVRNSNVDKIVADDEPAVRLCNYTDVYNNDRITPDMSFMEGTASDAEIDRFQLRAGQVLLTKDSESWLDIGVPALVAEDMPEVVCGYHLAVVDPGAELDGGYLAWLCRADPLNDQFKLGANGVTRFGLGQYPLKNAFIAVPPLETQRHIARFLDAKTAQIDALIAKKRALLERLAEKRQALITRAVTKGLDASVPMKDSGIDWLGQIPAHWSLRRLRFDVELNPKKSELILDDEVEVSFVPMEAVGTLGGLDVSITRPIGDVYGGYTYFADGDICVAKITPCFENGKGALAENLAEGVGFGTTELHVVRCSSRLAPKFLFYVTVAHAFRSVGEAEMLGAGGQKRVPERFIKDWMLPKPDIDEQNAIARRLDKIVASVDEAVGKISGSVNRLTEYRSALITAAVTGQLEIPADSQSDRPDERLGKLATEVA